MDLSIPFLCKMAAKTYIMLISVEENNILQEKLVICEVLNDRGLFCQARGTQLSKS